MTGGSDGPAERGDPLHRPGDDEILEKLDGRLEALDAGMLRDLLRARIPRLPPEDRAALLRALGLAEASHPEGRGGPDAQGASSGPPPSDPLWQDVEAFLERLRAGRYFRARRWDVNLGRERSLGDESWVDEVDALFARACDVFRRGDRASAARALGALLRAFAAEDRKRLFSGPKAPAEMVRTDLDAVKARYLRALFDTTPEEQRVKTLLQEVEALLRVGAPDIGLTEMIACDPAPLEGLDTFLPCWLERLSSCSIDGDRSIWVEVVRKLVREALVLAGGTEALAELARSQGDRHPEAYHDWVEALSRKGDLEGAVKAAKEGLRAIADPWHRAHLADRLAALAGRAGDPDLALRARRIAWRADPTLGRLLALVQEAREQRRYEEVLEEERAAIHDRMPRVGTRAAARLFLLAGDGEGAAELLEKAPGRGWSRSDHPVPVVLAYLLAVGGGAVPPPRGSFLATVWEALRGTRRERARGRRRPLSVLERKGVPGGASGAGRTAFVPLLQERLSERALSDAERRRMLEAARRALERRLDAVVRPRLRPAYASTIAAVLAYAEALTLRGAAADAEAFLRTVHGTYRRHTMFCGELETARRRSAILGRGRRARS